jgi:hypothetical protein
MIGWVWFGLVGWEIGFQCKQRKEKRTIKKAQNPKANPRSAID